MILVLSGRIGASPPLLSGMPLSPSPSALRWRFGITNSNSATCLPKRAFSAPFLFWRASVLAGPSTLGALGALIQSFMRKAFDSRVQNLTGLRFFTGITSHSLKSFGPVLVPLISLTSVARIPADTMRHHTLASVCSFAISRSSREIERSWATSFRIPSPSKIRPRSKYWRRCKY